MSIREEMIEELRDKAKIAAESLLQRQEEKKWAEDAIAPLIYRIADIEDELVRLVNER